MRRRSGDGDQRSGLDAVNNPLGRSGGIRLGSGLVARGPHMSKEKKPPSDKRQEADRSRAFVLARGIR